MSDDNENVAPPSAAEVMSAKHAKARREASEHETAEAEDTTEKAVASRASRKR